MKKYGRNLRIAFAGGGTGGHIFPGIALAQEFQKRDPMTEVLFFGTRRGLDTKLIPDYGYQLKLISAEALKGKTAWEQLRSLSRIPGAVLSSFIHLSNFRPDLVIGLGGYSSGPVLLAAFLRRIPIVILEPNSIPGLANRILGVFARRVFISYSQAERYFNRRRVVLSGNPLRPELVPPSLPESGGSGGDFHLMILGGSQGSRRINTSVVEGLEHLSRGIPKLKIVHQTGVADRDLIQHAYQQAGFPARVTSFIQDMSAAYAEADLVIARAGATTLSELTVWGRPAILIPYPHSANQHQRENARAMVENGAAVTLEDSELSGEYLARVIVELYRDRERRLAMGKKSREMARPRAREEVVTQCMELVRRK